jgi:serine kinase of HPr protein (carbohydrate metabolism regulator)
MNLYASCVVWQGMGVLLRGPSGIGKSDLALRLIDDGAVLVADDRVLLERDGNQLLASPPDVLAGLLEVRGLGILRFPYQTKAPIRLVVQLVEIAEMERLPESAIEDILGISLPLRTLSAREPSAHTKVRLAMQHAAGLIMSAP